MNETNGKNELAKPSAYLAERMRKPSTGFWMRMKALFSVAPAPPEVKAYEIDLRKIAAMEAASGQVGPDGGKFSAAPACLKLVALDTGWLTSKGGILLSRGGYHGRKDNESRYAGANYMDYVRYGVVIGCGVYQQRDGTIVWDFPGWPLPPGTVVEHEVTHAMKTVSVNAGELERVRCDTVSAWWYPGEYDPWMYYAAQELKDKGANIPDIHWPSDLKRGGADQQRYLPKPEISKSEANLVHT